MKERSQMMGSAATTHGKVGTVFIRPPAKGNRPQAMNNHHHSKDRGNLAPAPAQFFADRQYKNTKSVSRPKNHEIGNKRD
jgi:hypothetical protein